MSIAKGSTYLVLFVINEKPIMVSTVFTGQYVDVDGIRNYFFVNEGSDKPYTFTAKELTAFLPLNDESLRGTVDELTI